MKRAQRNPHPGKDKQRRIESASGHDRKQLTSNMSFRSARRLQPLPRVPPRPKRSF
jgi:hypothetical protein